jgi:TRAP-type mannitol/chloroaromatic compound transport system substrate-binding protein
MLPVNVILNFRRDKVKRKASLILVVLVLIGAVVLAACAAPTPTTTPPTTTPPTTTPTTPPTTTPPPSAEVIKINLGNFYAGGWPEEACEMIKEKCEAASLGQLEFTILPGDTAVPTMEHVTAVQEGIFDICYLGEYRFLDTVPVYNLFRTAGLREPKDMELLCDYGGWGDLMTRYYDSISIVYIDRRAKISDCLISRVPIETLDDVKNLKIRSVGIGAEVFAELGAAVTFITPEEVYSSLSSGLIDATDLEDYTGYYSKGYADIAKYWIYPPLQNTIGAQALVANPDFWADFPDGYKVLLQEVFKEISHKQNNDFDYMAKKDLSDVAANNGVTIITWSDEDIKRFKQIEADKTVKYPDDPWWSEAWDLLEQFKVDMGYK